MDLGIQRKRALICGASSGIGLACARALSAEGAEVWLVARGLGRLEQAVRDINGEGGKATAIVADLSNPESIDIIKGHLPDCDILITSPGGSPSADILAGTQAWTDGINSMVVNLLDLINAYIDGMSSRKFGRVLNVTTSAVHIANPGLAFSGALRAALTHATTTLARRVAGQGITINNIAPGPVESDGLQGYFERRAKELDIDAASVRADRLLEIPSGRFAEAEEIGRLCAFMSSVHTRNITGRTLLVDGGSNPYPFL